MEKIKKIINNKIQYIIIAIVAVAISFPLFQNGISTGHDGDFHISRTIGTIEQINNSESPFVISRFSRNLGYAWNLFYPPITTIINVMLAFITGEFIVSMKIFIFITIIFSGITMYKLVYDISKNRLYAIISSIIYILVPYRILNTYIRLAVGEMLSMLYIPINFRGIYHLLKGNTKKHYLFILGSIALILTHNISTMLCAILGIIYVLINIKKLKDKNIFKTLCISAVIIVLSVLFFEVPLLEQKSAAEYEVFRYGKMYSRESVQSHALSLNQLLVKDGQGADDQNMFFCLGVPIILGLVLTILVHKKVPKTLKKEYNIFLIAGLISAFMTTKYFPWNVMPDILLMVQFPWRILIMAVFCLSIIVGINYGIVINIITEKIKETRYITKTRATKFIFIIGTLLAIIYSCTFLREINIKEIGTEHYQEEEIIDTVMEVSRYSSYLEYWPQKAVRNINYILDKKTDVKILEGSTEIENENKNNGKLGFEIHDTTEDTKIELPYLYYKGYEIKLETDNNKIEILESRESEKGLLETTISQGCEGKIEVQYKMTTIHKVCLTISLITIIGYVCYLIVTSQPKKIS